jgi:protocatechuate 3,4-dioxygenase alpha subunit
MPLGVTAFQTVGPYFDVLLRTRANLQMVTPETKGERITFEGVLRDGAGLPIRDGLVEIWQADADGRYAHPDDPRGASADPAFSGYGWRHTTDDGGFHFSTIKPGSVVGPDGRAQAPHIMVSVMARGILTRFITRLYFEDAENSLDPILQLVPESRRHTVIAGHLGEGRYRFDIRLQGADETVFFDA